MSDNQTICELYLSIVRRVFEESGETIIKRTGPQTVIVDGQEKNITDWLYEISELGTQQFTVWSIYANDSKSDPTKKAGDVLMTNGRYGGCRKDVRDGSGGIMGPPVERLKNYNVLIMCRNKEGLAASRCVKVNTIFQVKAGGTIYKVV